MQIIQRLLERYDMDDVIEETGKDIIRRTKSLGISLL